MDIDKILKKLRISELNEMQQHAAEAILCSDGDVVLLSPTGTGKTLAYLLPLIQQLDATSDDVQALVVVPGRELALQSDTVLRDMGSGIRSASCYGGRATMDEHRKLKEVNPQIIFGTPGRLNDHLDKENINRYHIRWLVIDEFDKCLAMGFHQEMQKLIKSLPALQRRILLSATNAEQIPQFVNMAKKGTLVDFLPEEEQTSERVTLYEVKSPQKDKLETLRNLLLGFGDESSIVFLNADHPWAQSKVWLFVFLGASIIFSLIAWQNAYSALTLATSVLCIVAYWLGQPRLTRLLSIPAAFLTLIYNYIYHSREGVLCEIFIITSAIVGYFRHDFRKKHLEKENAV